MPLPVGQPRLRKSNSLDAETKTEVRCLSDEGAPDRRRGRSADRCRQGQSLGSQGCHHNPAAFRHACDRPSLDLRWDQIDFCDAVPHVRRAKKGTPATHPIVGDEMRALRKLQRDSNPSRCSCSPASRGRRSRRQVLRACGARWCRGQARLSGSPSMLRHACGFALANKGHDTRAFRPTPATEISSTRCDTPSCRRAGFKTSGDDIRGWAYPLPLVQDRVSGAAENHANN